MKSYTFHCSWFCGNLLSFLPLSMMLAVGFRCFFKNWSWGSSSLLLNCWVEILWSCPFHYRGQEYKRRKSRNTCSNKHIWPWNTEWSRAKANRVLPRERTGHSKHPLPTTEEKTLHMDITRWSTPKSDWLYSLQPKMEKL